MSDKPTGAHALSGLIAKRAEIAGQIEATRAGLQKLIVDLDHIDAAIRIFDPDHDVSGIRAKRTAQVTRRGDSIRQILDMLRGAEVQMTTRQIALQVMAARGHSINDAALVLTMTRRVGASLRSYRENGTIRSIKDGRYGKYDLWEIAR